MNVLKKINMNVLTMDNILSVNNNFDIIKRSFRLTDNRMIYMYYVDGFLKDSVIQEVLRFILSLKKEEVSKITDAKMFSEVAIPSLEVDIECDFEKITTQILSGCLAMFIDNMSECTIIDCREYPQRSIKEPDKDKVLRGAKDGFIETPIFNVALIRRRIRNKEFMSEHIELGSETKNDVILCYMNDKVDKGRLEKVKKMLNGLNTNDLTMGSQSLTEALFKKRWLSPFPKVRFVERPDVAASCVLEGKIVIIVDNTPAVIVLPTYFVDFFEETVDFYFSPPIALYLKLTRIFIAFITLFLTPLWLLAVTNMDKLPNFLSFLKINEINSIPLVIQLICLELIISLIRSASINIPDMIANSISLIGAIILRRHSYNY